MNYPNDTNLIAQVHFAPESFLGQQMCQSHAIPP